MSILVDLHDYDIERIEREILWKYNDNRHDYSDCDCLLSLRKDMINKRVLAHQEDILQDIIDFNDALRDALKEMYDRAHCIWDSIKENVWGDDVEVTAKCFLSYDYPELHPLQGEEREELWGAICDSGWNPLYDDGVTLPTLTLPRDINEDFDTFIGMDCPPPNWNEGLDRELTKDLHLHSAFHNIFDHMNFAITDFIYVRKFETEINIEINKRFDMTFKELLDCVRFEDVAPLIVKMYPDMGQSLGWYKIHFDMLRLMQPVLHEDANDKVCHITMKDWEDGSGLHLDAYPMEGDLWEHSLTKELVIAPEVAASNEELAACCLWHTSFYGFVEKQVDEHFSIYDLDMATLDRWNNSLYYKVRALKNFSVIREHGGFIPTIRQLSKLKKAELVKLAKDSVWFGSVPLNKIKRKKRLRIEFLEHYYERMTVISDFIVQAIRALKDARNYMRVEQLCELFHSELFCTEEIMSYASNGKSGAKYLYELFTSYDMIPKMDGIVVRLVTGTEHEVLTEDEILLCNLLAEGRKYGDLILDYDPALGNQVVISYAAYNSKKPLVK